ncbi:MAG: hypothetical protein QM790_03455 [Nibricoccus sp.]
MKHPSKIPFRNRNQTDWWVYGELEYWVSRRQKKLKPSSRCEVYENTRIMKAKSREQAYEKIMRLASKEFPSVTEGGEWRFKGISFLLPIYDEFDDGAEIIWNKCGFISQARLNRMAKSKRELPVFDDSE